MPECNICAAPYTKGHAYTCAQCAYTCCQICHVRALTEPTLGRCPGCPAALDLGGFLINVPVLAAGAQKILAEHFGKLLALRERDFALADPNSGESLAISRNDPSLAMDFLDTGAPLSHATYDNLKARTNARDLYIYSSAFFERNPEDRPVPYTNKMRRYGSSRATWRDEHIARYRQYYPSAAALLAQAPGRVEPRAASPDPAGEPAATDTPQELPEETEADLATIRAAGVQCRACPKCRAIISRVSGCSQMWCVLCHAKFDYVTGATITGFFHNPHFFSHVRRTESQRDRAGTDDQAGGARMDSLAVWYDEVLILCRDHIKPDRGDPDGAVSWADFCQAAYKTARAIIATTVFTGIIENARLGIDTMTCGEAVVRLRSAIAQFNAHKRLYATRSVPLALERAAATIELAPPAAPLVHERHPLNRPRSSATIMKGAYDMSIASVV